MIVICIVIPFILSVYVVIKFDKPKGCIQFVCLTILTFFTILLRISEWKLTCTPAHFYTKEFMTLRNNMNNKAPWAVKELLHKRVDIVILVQIAEIILEKTPIILLQLAINKNLSKFSFYTISI